MLPGLRLTGSVALGAAAVAAFFTATAVLAADDPVRIPVPPGVDLQATLGSAKSDPIRIIATGADLAVRNLDVDSPGAGDAHGPLLSRTRGREKRSGLTSNWAHRPAYVPSRDPALAEAI